MRKLIAVGVLIGGLLAGAGTAMAQLNVGGGNADRMSLAASGVLIPFKIATPGGANGPQGIVAVVEVASPVGPNLDLHLVFFNATCARVGSTSTPETTNDIAFVNIGSILSSGVPPVVPTINGLVAIAGTGSGTEMTPLNNPIHSRVYEFASLDGRSTIFEPIILDSHEWSTPQSKWSPLRTGMTFFAPLETATVKTLLTLVCPRATIQNATTTNLGIFPIGIGNPPTNTIGGFPKIEVPFNTLATEVSGKIYDTNEVFLRDITLTCDCYTELSVVAINSIYGLTPDPDTGTLGAINGTYTELEITSPQSSGKDSGVMTGWRSVSTAGSGLNNFFGPTSNGSRNALKTSPFGGVYAPNQQVR